MLTLREARPTDAAALLDIYAPFILHTTITFETEVPSEAAFAERVRQYAERFPWLLAEEEGRVLGYCYAATHRARSAYQWAVESSVFVAPQAQRRGLATTMYQTLLTALRAQGLHRVYAGVTLPNDASLGLHTALGFTPVGVYERVGFKHGAWRDTAWYQYSLSDGDDAPGPVTAPGPALARALAGERPKTP